MAKLAIVVTRTCQKYLGLTDQITWCLTAEEDLVDKLMCYVMKKGNFGRKLENGENSTVTVLHSFSNPKDAFSYLTAGGTIHMKAAGLKPIRTVAWLYQIGHLLRMGLNRKGRFSLKAEIKSAQEETDFLKRLEVTRL